MAQVSELEAQDTDDPKAWKWVIRKWLWDLMEARNIAQFPRPVHHRIPNFVGAHIAASKVSYIILLCNLVFDHFFRFNILGRVDSMEEASINFRVARSRRFCVLFSITIVRFMEQKMASNLSLWSWAHATNMCWPSV